MSISIKANTSEIKDLADRLRVTPEVIVRGHVRAINKVAAKALTASRRAISSKVNLKAGYVREHLDIRRRATAADVVAVLRGTDYNTRLSTMGPRQLTKPARGARGDRTRGIPPGRRADGLSIMVKRAIGRRKIPSLFMLPLRAGAERGGNGMGVFRRTSRDRIEHRYTRSVGGWFRSIQPEIEDLIIREIDDAVQRQISHEVRRALGI